MAFLTRSGEKGRCLKRIPLRAATAFATAPPVIGNPVSPIPVGLSNVNVNYHKYLFYFFSNNFQKAYLLPFQ